MVANAVAGDASRWDYVRDDNVVARGADSRTIYSGRLTSQITQRQQVAFYVHASGGAMDRQRWKARPTPAADDKRTGWPLARGVSSAVSRRKPTRAWTRGTRRHRPPGRCRDRTGCSSTPAFSAAYIPGIGNKPPDTALNLIPVQEQANIYGVVANWTYRGISTYSEPFASTNNWRAGVSYVTGANSAKVGYQGGYYLSDTRTLGNDSLLNYRFSNQIPNRVTFRIAPWETANRTMTHSIYVQDQWTKSRLTLAGALRYDRASSWSPAEHNGAPVPTIFNSQPITFERTDGVTGYHDLTPRMNVAYDLFGNGKTAIKLNVGNDTATNGDLRRQQPCESHRH